MQDAHTARDHTFVICAYKENPYLEELVRSIEGQTVLGSVLVATSTPNDHIARVCERHSLPLVVNEGETSIAHDWNFGYDHASTDLVTIAHQDDIYEPEYLERVIAAFNARPHAVGVVHTGYYELRGDDRVADNTLLKIKRILNRKYASALSSGDPESERKAFRFGDMVCCPSVTFAKSVVGPSVFETGYVNSCDYRTWVDLASRGVPFAHVPELLVGHRIYEESTTSKNIESNARTREDHEILKSLWPAPVAKVINLAYARGQKSNEL